MASIVEKFPYPLDEEPTEEWTVEEVLQYCLVQARLEMDYSYNNVAEILTQQLESGKEDLWQAHREQQQHLTENASAVQVNNMKISHDAENENPQLDSATVMTTATLVTTASTTVSSKTVIQIEIVGGKHAGSSYTLKPKVKYPCWVGRSQGKKFRDRGISLPKDLEVSTTHGKFELVNGKLCFTDTGSTNGSRIVGHGEQSGGGGDATSTTVPGELEADVPYPLHVHQPTELHLGKSILKITLH